MTSSKYQAAKLTKILLEEISKGIFDFSRIGDKKVRKNVSRQISYLKKNNLIGIKEVEGESILYLKEKGKIRVLRSSLENIKIERPKKWDGKWRMVAFDIPEKKKTARNYLKLKLDEMGFVKLQNSLYVMPFECEKEIELIRNLYEIQPYVQLIIANNFEEEERYKKIFNIR